MGKSEEFGVLCPNVTKYHGIENMINIETTFDLLKSKHVLTME